MFFKERETTLEERAINAVDSITKEAENRGLPVGDYARQLLDSKNSPLNVARQTAAEAIVVAAEVIEGTSNPVIWQQGGREIAITSADEPPASPFILKSRDNS